MKHSPNQAKETALRYGHFAADGREVVITTPETPRHWYNYLWNREYVSLFSQVGQGESLAQDEIAVRIPVVSERMVFVQDTETGESGCANGLPVDAPRDAYRCVHGLGYSHIESGFSRLETRFRVFVPVEGTIEVWTLRVANRGPAARRLRVFAFADTLFDGPLKPQAGYTAIGQWDAERQSALLTQHLWFNGRLGSSVFMTADRRPAGYDTRHRSFIGYGTSQAPAALRRGACGDSSCVKEKGILALACDVALDPGEETDLHVLVGAAVSRDDIAGYRERFFAPGGVEREFQRATGAIRAELEGVEFATPDATLNQFATHWLKRQVTLGTLWARVRHNGYRDLTQDIGALVFIQPGAVLERFKRVLARQHSDGHAPRTWMDGQIQDRGFSDNHVWIAYTVYNLVLETGDLPLLDLEVPFTDGSSASIYEHMKRAVDHLWNDRGRYGLCRIHQGDWNDSMRAIGKGGEGVSVWLSMAWSRANNQFRELATLHGRAGDAALAEARGREMAENIDRHAWDGEYYLRAYTDAGKTVGSSKDDHGKLFVNTQSWAVLGGVGLNGRAGLAMQAVDRYLDSDLGTRMMLPFDHYDPTIGVATRAMPGAGENGSVYLHASAFKLVADCLLKRRDRVETEMRKMLPFDETFHAKMCEPYVFCNSYLTVKDPAYYGWTGQSWATGTAGWFYYALVVHIFGLKPELAGLRVDPCLPPSWRECGIVRPFRGSVYRVTFRQEGEGGRVRSIVVDGERIEGTLLPYEAGRHWDVRVNVQ